MIAEILLLFVLGIFTLIVTVSVVIGVIITPCILLYEAVTGKKTDVPRPRANIVGPFAAARAAKQKAGGK